MEKFTDNIDAIKLELYVPGQLKCEDCVYDSNCEEKFKRCVANGVNNNTVEHLICCEKNYINEMKSKILNLLEQLEKE